MIALISAAAAPGIALLSYFYLRDKYDSEPIGMIVRTFILGALVVLPVMFIQYALRTEHIGSGIWMNAFFINGLLEEFIKWFLIIYTAYHHVAFNERYDGIVYSVSVSLGFATLENIFYLYAYGIHYALFRALLPVSMHALTGVIMGYYIGQAKFSGRQKKNRLLTTAFLSAAACHGLFDFLLNIHFAWYYTVLPFMIFLWWNGLYKVRRSIRSDAASPSVDDWAGDKPRSV